MSDKQIPQPALSVEVMNPLEILFQGQATAVSSANPRGKFDILPNHAPFISLIKDSVTVHLDSEKSKKFELDRGVIRCFDNKVEVYLEV